MTSDWAKNSWRKKVLRQLPVYPDVHALNAVERKLETLPPLVIGGEVYGLRSLLAEVTAGKAFVVQGGDCAESFAEFNADTIRDTFRVLLQMSVILSFVGEKRIVKIGRCAGQFAKPRSSDVEVINGETLPAYRGDIINGSRFSAEDRVPDPNRILTAYYQSTTTLNYLRALDSSGFTDTNQAQNWLLDFVENSSIKTKYMQLAKLIQRRYDFLERYRLGGNSQGKLDIFSSHEALLLPYEEALTRLDSTTNEYIATSGHFLWIGDRTRQLDGAHVEFLRGVANPIGIKCGSTLNPEELVRLLELVNPYDVPGKVTLIVRMGAGKVKKHFPALIAAVKRSGRSVVWMCDPMHGNTEKNEDGVKFRSLDKIHCEIREFFEVCQEEGIYAGGLHLEMTGKNVTECIGGPREIDLSQKYETTCDPRLNDEQVIDLSFRVCELLGMNSGLGSRSKIQYDSHSSDNR